MKPLKIRLDNLYTHIFCKISATPELLTPYVRRLLRFVALPYCYICLINWNECNKSKIGVVYDLLYIFFRLKYYPFNYSLCRLWEKPKHEWKYYYGSNYEPYQRARLLKEVQRKEYAIIFDDKEICYQICKSYYLPLPKQYGCIDTSDDYRNRIVSILESNPNDTLIIKPVRGAGGKDIVLANKQEGAITIRDGLETYGLNEYELKNRSVVQKYLKQHQSLQKISSTFNTIRVVTMLTKASDFLLVGAFIRFGVASSYVDNLCSGGIAVGVDVASGKLFNVAYDFNSQNYACHPTSGIYFSEITIPLWGDIVSLAEKTQSCFKYYKLLGLDIGVTEDGPVLIEINPAHDNIALEQNSGPILKNAAVLKAYREYDLLPRSVSLNDKGDFNNE